MKNQEQHTKVMKTVIATKENNHLKYFQLIKKLTLKIL